VIQSYKDTVRINYIFAAPNKAFAYYALFQEVNGFMIFDPFSNKDDIKCFAAVATSLNNFYPHADRSKNLYNMVIKGMKNTRMPKQKTMEVPQINESGIIDIDLKDMRGVDRKLSDLKGKVVLLDFTAYQTAVSVSHNFMLRELYDKYASQGLEIYQVSFDTDEHFWKTSADNLPWICVRDPNGVYSSAAAVYNVQKLPTYFLVNRNNELSARDENIKNLEETIKKML
jgi:peroxiredoxin